MIPVIFRGADEAGFFAHALHLSPFPSPLDVLPGNARDAHTHYACLIVVKDYHRMLIDTRAAGEWHYRDLDEDILADVRARRAVLVFDLSNEGPTYDPEIFLELYAWIEAQGLPPGRVIWLAQNRAVAAAAAAHVGERAQLVRFEYYDYFVKLMAWIFSPSSPEQARGLDPEGYLRRLFDAGSKDKLLLCLNATPRMSRVLTVGALQHAGLLGESLVSFPGLDYVKSGVSMAEVASYLDTHPLLEPLRAAVTAVAAGAPLRIDAFSELGNELVDRIDPNAYQRSFFSLVTESDFSGGEVVRVTEKTAKAFCMGHPTLVVGNPHSIRFLTDFGFQDWGPVFDRSLEAVLDPGARFAAVQREILAQRAQIEAGRQAWLDRVREVGLFNFRHAVSGAFLEHYATRVDRKIVENLAALLDE